MTHLEIHRRRQSLNASLKAAEKKHRASMDALKEKCGTLGHVMNPIDGFWSSMSKALGGKPASNAVCGVCGHTGWVEIPKK